MMGPRRRSNDPPAFGSGTGSDIDKDMIRAFEDPLCGEELATKSGFTINGLHYELDNEGVPHSIIRRNDPPAFGSGTGTR